MRAAAIFLRALGIFAVVVLLAACKRDDMADQPRVNPLRPNPFFANNSSARMPPAGTVSTDAPLDPAPFSWLAPSQATAYPFTITRNDLLRGQQQFMIYCAPCHGLLGDGEGMIPDRGITRPPSFHTDRLRSATPTYFYNVMTLGIGAMFPYNDRVASDDRWRIAAYIRALQLSQNTPPTPAGGAP